MKRVLALHYSQSGQLRDVLFSALAPLHQHAEIELVCVELKPRRPYPFPWPFWQFFDTFPETVAGVVEDIEPLPIADTESFDLIILAYQVWFLSPSLPTTAFLQSAQAQRLLNGKPVITLIGCRNMWLMAQEKVKKALQTLGAHLIDNAVLTDPAHSAFTFVATPLWLMTGNRGPFLSGLIPAAGIAAADIKAAERFGHAIATQLPTRAIDDTRPMFSGLGAVQIRERLIASEHVAQRSFAVWGKVLRTLGPRGSIVRRIALAVYVVFLITLILTVVPISAVLKKLASPMLQARIQRQRAYYAHPSGEAISVQENL
jgi:hypothetical protein